MNKISADVIFPVASAALRDSVLILDEQGKILAIEPKNLHDASSVRHFQGALAPAFINTHCHLELSHLQGKAPTGVGLLPFLKTVVTLRETSQEEILAAIAKADADMYAAGIQAVGDISNKTDTAQQKSESKMDYYTFIEMFDFLQKDRAQATFEQYKSVWERQDQSRHNRKSCTPHAPYSVSASLFQKIKEHNAEDAIISIHNQETPHENELFLAKTGNFLDFFANFGISLQDFAATHQASIYYAMQHLSPKQRTIFVHNTTTTRADIAAAQRWNKHVFWATCPNANLYIENRLPNYQLFLEEGAKVTIGTDSLTSNWQLSIWEEMKSIAKYQSYLPHETLLRWATLHGAEALGFDDRLGSLEVGKQPGIVLLPLLDNGAFDWNRQCQRIV